MNKTKKGLLTAGSILTIVSAAFAILGALLMFFLSGFMTEKIMKESYMEDPEYTYTENVDGSYFFTTIENGVEVTITEDDIALVTKIVSGMFIAIGLVALGFSVARLVLAIRLLLMNGRNEYAKGTTIALVVMSFLNSSLLEAILFIIAMCQKDEEKSESQPQQPDVITEAIE